MSAPLYLYSLRLSVLWTLLALFAFTACTGSRKSASDSPDLVFQEGQSLYERGRYTRAIEELQRVFEYGRVHEWADDAQYLLGRAYFESEQYLLAANELDRFIGLYPGDDRIEEAAYYRAMSYYRLSPPYNLDQTDTERAIDYLRLFLNRYPNSEFAEDLGAKIDELQSKLARKLMDAAALYVRSERFEAAALTYERVLAEYPATPYVDESLLGAMRAYKSYADVSVRQRKQERYEKAIAVYDQLFQLFPESPVLKAAEELYDEIVAELQELSG